MTPPELGDLHRFSSCMEWAQEGERFFRLGKPNEGIRCLLNAIEVRTDDLKLLSVIYCQLGNAFFSLGKFTQAAEYHSYDIIMSRLLNDSLGEAKASGNAGNSFKQAGNYHDAIIFTTRQLELAREVQDKQCEARALYGLGTIFHLKARHALKLANALDDVALGEDAGSPIDDGRNAVKYYEQSLEISEVLRDWVSCGRLYGGLGNAYYLLKDFDKSIEYHQKRLEIANQFGDKAGKRRAYTNLGNAHVFTSAYDRAIEFYRLALSLACEMRDRAYEAQTCFSLANVSSMQYDHHTASEYYLRHLKITRELKDRVGEKRACQFLSSTYRNIGDIQKAAYFLARQRQIGTEINAFPQATRSPGTKKQPDCSAPQGLKQPVPVSTKLTNDMVTVKQAETALRTLIQHNEEELLDSTGQVHLDASMDPDSLSACRLSLSYHSLTGDFEDCGLNRSSQFHSDGDITSRSERCRGGGSGYQEDLIEMLTRLQGKRMDEQRCDAAVLLDRTNRAPRQTDTLQPSPCDDKPSRRLSLGGKLSTYGRRVSLVWKDFKDIRPMHQSTPIRAQSADTSAMANTRHHSLSSTLLRSFRGKSKNSTRSPSIVSLSSMVEELPVSDERQTSMTSGGSDGFRIPQLPPVLPPRQQRSEEPPVPPPRANKKGTMPRPHSMFDIKSPFKKEKHGPEALIELLMNAQGRRMDEQRADFLPGLNPESERNILEKYNEASGERDATPALDEHLVELLLRAQSQRMNEQRSELGGRTADGDSGAGDEQRAGVAPTMPEDDLQDLVMRMAAGRLEEQRAHLASDAPSA